MPVPRFILGARHRAHAARAAAALALTVGYADLARGGSVVAPIALVIGYAVLVPIALLIH